MREKINVELLKLALYVLLEKLTIVPKSLYEDKIKEAYNIAKEFDGKDTPFIALAIKLKVPIWTQDKALIKNSLTKKTGHVALDTIGVEELLSEKTLNEVLDKLEKRFKEKES